MCDVAIIMPYFDRQSQLDVTLQSFEELGYDNIRVVIVDDKSPTPLKLKKTYGFFVTILYVKDKYWRNPEPAYNIGIDWVINNTTCDKIILQNPECYHKNNVVDYTRNFLTEENYITFGCCSLDKKGKFHSWYNHSLHRPVAYEFCAAIHVNNLMQLNGYDERLCFGIGYGDNYFLHRVKLLGLDVQIIDSCLVAHQWHPVVVVKDRKQLLTMNKVLFEQLKQTKEIKALRYFTKGL